MALENLVMVYTSTVFSLRPTTSSITSEVLQGCGLPMRASFQLVKLSESLVEVPTNCIIYMLLL